jgi:hypothetical protein
MSRIFDSSALTQRKRDLAQAGSFINRIQSTTNPQTSYGPLQGNYDASVMNSVKMGQPKEFYRNNGCVIVSNGCPCPPITTLQISSDTPILAPGPVRGIDVRYGSVIVTWLAPDPDTGGTPTSYTVIATPKTPGLDGLATGIIGLTYSFATGSLTPGVEYDITVFGVNSAGNGTAPAPQDLPLPISAPFIAPTISLTSNSTTPNTVTINFNYSAFDIIASSTQYTYTTFINGENMGNTTGTLAFTNKIVLAGLSVNNQYSFVVQLFNSSENKYSSLSNQPANVNVYPAGPTITSVSSITATSVSVNYSFLGFDLTGATCIIGNGPSGVSFDNLTNTSVTLTNLTSAFTYASGTALNISFSKTINGSLITSGQSTVLNFSTYGIVPVVNPSPVINTTETSAIVTINSYSAANLGEFTWDAAVISGLGSGSIQSVTSPNTINLQGLTSGSVNNCTLYLRNTTTGIVSLTTSNFQVLAKSEAPTISFISATTTTCTLSIGPYSPFAITSVKAYETTNVPAIELNVTYDSSQSRCTITSGLAQLQTYNVKITVSNGITTSVESNQVTFNTTGPALTNIRYTSSLTELTVYYDSYGAFIPLNQASLTYNYLIGSISGTQTVDAAVIGATSSVFVLLDPNDNNNPLPQGTFLSEISIVIGNGTYSSLPASIPDFLFIEAPQNVTDTADENGVLLQFTNYSNPELPISRARLNTDQGSFDISTFDSDSVTFTTGQGLQRGVIYTNCTLVLINENVNPIRFSTPSGPSFTFRLLYPAPIINSAQSISFRQINVSYTAEIPVSIAYLVTTDFTNTYSTTNTSPIAVFNNLPQNTQFNGCQLYVSNGTFNTALSSNFGPQNTTDTPTFSVTGSTVIDNSITITYDQTGTGQTGYEAFTPTQCELTATYNGNTQNFSGSANTLNATISGLSGGDYTNCTLQIRTSDTPQYNAQQNSSPFSFSIT